MILSMVTIILSANPSTVEIVQLKFENPQPLENQIEAFPVQDLGQVFEKPIPERRMIMHNVC